MSGLLNKQDLLANHYKTLDKCRLLEEENTFLSSTNLQLKTENARFQKENTKLKDIIKTKFPHFDFNSVNGNGQIKEEKENDPNQTQNS